MLEQDENLVCGSQVQTDNSYVGHNWKNINAEDIPTMILMEIIGEMLDGGRETCEKFIASNGQHYAW